MTRPRFVLPLAASGGRVAIAALGVTTLLGVAACSAGDEQGATPTGTTTTALSSPTEAPATTIELWLRAEPREAAAYEAVVAAYEEAHPDVEVELTASSGDDYLPLLTSSLASDEPPDVFVLGDDEFAPFVQRGEVEPIGPLIDVDLAAYFDQPVEAFTLGGTLQCMPEDVSSLVVYINVAMFDALGLEHPVAPWTWDEFAAAARALTTPDVHGLGIDTRLTQLAPFIWSNGGEVVDDPVAPRSMTLAEPAAREALEMLIALQAEGVSPTPDDGAPTGLDELFMNGTLAMYLGPRADTARFRASDLDFDVAPMPVLRDAVSLQHTEAFCLTAGLDSSDAAVDFIDFAVGEQGQSLAARGGLTVPSLTAVAQSPAFLDPTVRPASSQVFLDAIPLLRRVPVLTTWPAVEQIVDDLLAQAFYDDRPLDEVLVEINEAADPLLEAGAVAP